MDSRILQCTHVSNMMSLLLECSLEEVLADTLGCEAGGGGADGGQAKECGGDLLISDSEASEELPLGIPLRSVGSLAFPGAQLLSSPFHKM